MTARSEAPMGASSPRVPERLWASMLVRAVPALVAALVITFAQDRQAAFVLVVFGGFALATGVLIGFEAIGIPGHPTRGITFARAVVTTLAGGTGLVLGTVPGAATPFALLVLIAAWAAVTGVLELLAGLIARRYPAFSRDVVISGALTLLLAVLVFLTPAELRQEYGGLEQIPGALTSPVQAAGFFGAYATVLCVLLVVEGLTLRAATRRDEADGEPA
ncbi:MAG: hypothetical protein Q4E05_09745 [Pseudoclavibacter sp.]|nr:hypothetical protein [Pseudoclavibacter sp.]